MNHLVECVPNFSEGRRLDIVDQIVEAMESIPNTHVLDAQSDADHNRSVVTLVGPPEAIEEAAFQGIAQAAELIDMNDHQGGHPRIGATDVVPFVPIRGVTKADCVEMARRLGHRVGSELDIPVYLYGDAATRPDRVSLPDIRKGQYEGLKAEVGTNPDRAPDFGPARLESAGATVIGVRPFLIAFNVYLNTADVNIARQIARAVRHSSGGLRFVKALGLEVGGQAQVSMNLTDYTRTPIHCVVEMIRSEAARYGAVVTRSELVGLAPQEALMNAAAWHLQLDLNPEQVLENRLTEEDSEPSPYTTLTPFLEATASEAPAPGGGSVAALAGALTAALTAMVARLTLGRKRYADAEEEMEEVLADAERLREALARRVAEDAAAYDGVVDAYRLPRETAEQKAARQEAIQDALTHAAEVPLSTARDAVAALRLACRVAQRGNPNALTDAGTAAHMAKAAFEGAAFNVRINAGDIVNREKAAGWMEEISQLRAECDELLTQALFAVEERWPRNE